MSCANSFIRIINGESVQIPCGWCLNCRVDKRNWLADLCRFEKSQYPSTSFVTLTYDDSHLLDKYVVTKDGSLSATLSKKDVKDFNKRLRRHFDYHKNYYSNSSFFNYKILSNGSVVPDYKFLLVGEYGTQGQVFDRPHYHAIYFGLDPQVCKDVFYREWQGGIIDVDYIKTSGGIPYVLKYLDKQLFGKQAEQEYDDNGLERPFMVHSQKLGEKYIRDNIDDIIQNNFSYHSMNNIRRPLSTYYKNKLLAETAPDNDFIISYLNAKKAKKDENGKYSLHQMNQARKEKALLRLEHLEKSCINAGEPFLPVPKKSTASTSVNNTTELVNKALGIIPGIPF